MKYLLTLILLSGCSISNEEIVKREKYCREHKLFPMVQLNGFTGMITNIICVPLHTARSLMRKEAVDEYVQSLNEEK